jgi:hypothetical protein
MFGGRPLTGASKNVTPRPAQASATRRIVAGALVVRSIYAPPSRSPASSPTCGANTTSSTCLGPGSEVNTTSLASAAAAVLSTARAPCPTSAAIASARASKTASSCPAAIRQAAIGVPIVPVPTKPMRMGVS